MLHGDDNLLGPGAQVHGPAHTGHHLAGDDPVGQIALLVHLERAQHGGVHVAAPDQAEGGGGVDERAAHGDGGGRAARVAHVEVVDLGLAARAGHAQLGLQDDVHIIGQVGGDHGGQADAQVDKIAVLELLGGPLGDKALNHSLFH